MARLWPNNVFVSLFQFDGGIVFVSVVRIVFEIEFDIVEKRSYHFVVEFIL